MEGGRWCGALGDKVYFQFNLMETYGPVGAERSDNLFVFTQEAFDKSKAPFSMRIVCGLKQVNIYWIA